nr:unnamed protein product [Callosobruchus chinensis]
MLDDAGKLLEKLIRARLRTAIVEAGGLSDNQHGFRPGHSTIGAIQEVVNYTNTAWAGNHRTRDSCILVTLDVKNAFNSARFNTALQTLLKPRSIDNADQLMDTLTAACNQSMPRRANTSKRGPVYWWTQEIGELRRECLKARRAYTRKNLPEHAREIRGLNYKLARQTLRVAIKTSKSRCWKKLMEEVDDDIWGKGYRIVFKRTKLGPSLPNMSVERRRLVAEALFPSQPRVVYNTQPETPLNHFTIDELLAASEKLKAKKTPGVDCIPAEIIKIAVTEAPDIFLKVCNSALATGCFPTRWKCADLVLIPKKNRHIDTPSAYRALCVLDAAGKLLEHLILGRLVNHIESNDSLSCNQFGFRKGRSTIGAIEKIVAIARQAAVTVNRRKKICALVALDIKNAFNSAPRQKIVEELERIGVDRELVYQTTEGFQRKKVSAGVAQGSVLGPDLWNIMYDGILRMEIPE